MVNQPGRAANDAESIEPKDGKKSHLPFCDIYPEEDWLLG